MSTKNELSDFVRDALSRGIPRPQIEESLSRAGWNEVQIRQALAFFAEIDFPIPVPRPKPYVSAREAFLFLVLFSALYVSAYHLGSLIFDLINKSFPDPADASWLVSGLSARMRFSVSSLIVAFPVFLFVTRLIARAQARDPLKRESLVRRWLTYMTLFIAAGVLIGDVIALINGLLGGELTTRFVLKVITVGGITSAIFGYYLWDLRPEEKSRD